MKIADERPPANVNLLLDRESLALSIDLVLNDGDAAPDALARLFLEFKEAVDSGLEGIVRASEALLTAVEITYLHSRSHDAAWRLYLLSQQGRLKVEDEPMRLIGAAIGRSTTERAACVNRGKGRRT